MSFQPIALRPDSPLQSLPGAFAQDLLDGTMACVAPRDEGTPEEQAGRCAAALQLLEACNPRDPLQAVFAQDLVLSHYAALRCQLGAIECMTASQEQTRGYRTAEELRRGKRQALGVLQQLQGTAKTKAGAAAGPAKAVPAAPAPEPQPAAEPAAAAEPAEATPAPAGLVVRKLPRPARKPVEKPPLPDWFWRPDGTRLDEPPQLWTDNHRRPDGTVPKWDMRAVDAMSMEERRAAWWYSAAARQADAEAAELFPNGDLDDPGWRARLAERTGEKNDRTTS